MAVTGLQNASVRRSTKRLQKSKLYLPARTPLSQLNALRRWAFGDTSVTCAAGSLPTEAR